MHLVSPTDGILSRTDGHTASETLILAVLVALGGITAFTFLGKGAGEAIAGRGGGSASVASASATTMVTSTQAGTEGNSDIVTFSGQVRPLASGSRIATGAELIEHARATSQSASEGNGATPSIPAVAPAVTVPTKTRSIKPSTKHRNDEDALEETRTKNLLLSLGAITNGNHGEAGKPAPVGVVANIDQITDALNRTPDPNGKMSAAEILEHIQFWQGRLGNVSDFDLAKRRGETSAALAFATAMNDTKSAEFLQFVNDGLASEQNFRRYEDSIISELNRRGKLDSPTFAQSMSRLLAVRGGREEGISSMASMSLDGIDAMRDDIASRMASLEQGDSPLTSDQVVQAQALQGTDEILMHEQFVRGKRSIAPAVKLSAARAQAGGVADRSQWPHYSSPKDFGYQNARIPADRLEPVDDEGHRLWYPAAIRFRAMKAAMQKAGVWAGLSDAYRDYDTQSEAYYSKGPGGRNEVAVARPGTSNHGWGMAVDIAIGNGTFEWLSAHAAEYGFDNIEGAGVNENWHWGYTGVDER